MAKNPSSNNLESIQSTVTVRSPDGVEVPVTVTLSYPAGQGLYALRVAASADINEEPLFDELIRRQDASTIKFLAGTP